MFHDSRSARTKTAHLGTSGQAQVYESPATTVQFILFPFNLADPANPQSGLDESGKAIDQGYHPVLGDVRVRQALMHAMDWNVINAAGLNNEGIQLASQIELLPTPGTNPTKLSGRC